MFSTMAARWVAPRDCGRCGVRRDPRAGGAFGVFGNDIPPFVAPLYFIPLRPKHRSPTMGSVSPISKMAYFLNRFNVPVVCSVR